MKNTINLTEKDLHRIIRECINEALDEVQLGGESLHGNNPQDWLAMSSIRSNKACYSNGKEREKHTKNSQRDLGNLTDLCKDATAANGGWSKARRIGHELGKNPIKRFVSNKINQFKG